MKRILIAAITGGLIMFAWGAFSHMVLPLGGAGLESLPNEDAILASLRSIPEAGTYFFPGTDMGKDMTSEQQTAWEAKYRSGPVGLLVYRPAGGDVLSPRRLVNELASNILAAAVAAYLASLIAGPFGCRVLAMGLLGLIAWLSLSISYWNWYSFDITFICAEGVDQVAGWLLSGLAIAKIVPPVGS